jgi:integrase
MGSIRARKETGKLFLDFQFLGQRCREQTLLDDTPANKKKLKGLLEKIEAEITLGQFNYSDYFPGSSQAKRFAVQARTITGQLVLPLFKDFSKVWYEEMKVGWRITYQGSISRVLNNRIMDYFGEMEVGHITKADLLQFRAQLGGVVRKNGKGYSADHINRHMKVLRMILNEAADRFDFTSPYRGIKPLKVPKSDVDPFTLDEINQLLATVRPDFRNYYTVRFFTGMRTGEIDGLKWRYVNFDSRQILVRETLVDGRVEYTKTDGSQREIEMSEPVYQALKNQYEATKEHEYVFITKSGTTLSHNNVTKRVWYPLLRHLGFRKRTPYQTRHTAATLWLASGENPEWIARQMGHSNTEMLFRVYSRYVPNLTRKDGSAIENLLLANLNVAKERT